MRKVLNHKLYDVRIDLKDFEGDERTQYILSK